MEDKATIMYVLHVQPTRTFIKTAYKTGLSAKTANPTSLTWNYVTSGYHNNNVTILNLKDKSNMPKL